MKRCKVDEFSKTNVSTFTTGSYISYASIVQNWSSVTKDAVSKVCIKQQTVQLNDTKLKKHLPNEFTVYFKQRKEKKVN